MSYHDECPKCYGPSIKPFCKDCGHDVEDALQAEVARLRETLGAILDREELDLKHAYTTCDVGDSTNADRGCIWCVARAALREGGE